jgi:hypothetical protein
MSVVRFRHSLSPSAAAAASVTLAAAAGWRRARTHPSVITTKLGIKLKDPVFHAVVVAWPAISPGVGARKEGNESRCSSEPDHGEATSSTAALVFERSLVLSELVGERACGAFVSSPRPLELP